MIKIKIFIFSIVFAILLIIAGWVKNIIKLTNCDFEAPYKAEIIHTIGIIPIVGAITGWMNFEDYGKKEQNKN